MATESPNICIPRTLVISPQAHFKISTADAAHCKDVIRAQPGNEINNFGAAGYNRQLLSNCLFAKMSISVVVLGLILFD